MDVGSKEVLMESPPVSVIMCVCMRVVGLSGPVSSSKFIHSTHLGLC